jgi:hypothetical protein
VRWLSPWEIAEYLDPQQETKFSPSDKSAYAEHFVSMAGSLEAAGELLNDGGLAKIVELYLNKDRRKTSITEHGFLSKGRRYCGIELLSNILGDRDEARQLVDRLLVGSFFRRGFVLKCSLCRNSDWYDADDVGQVFRCSRCRERHGVRRERWNLTGSEDLPTYYALHEMAYQCLRNGCDVTIKLASLLKRDSRSAIFALEADVVGFGKDMQLDLLAIIDGSVVLGECKGGIRPKNSDIKKSLAEYSKLATRIRADRIVFARAGSDWKEEVVATAKRMDPPIECIRIEG